MISERDFSVHYGSFWRETLPNLESVTRSLNLASLTEWEPMPDLNDPQRRDLIAETAFNMAAIHLKSGNEDAEQVLSAAQKLALKSLQNLTRKFTTEPIAPLSGNEIEEVLIASRRIRLFSTSMAQTRPIIFRPRFRGHGFVHQCEGDLRVGGDIFEFKYVSRNFRSSDFKQLLVYNVLHWFGAGDAFEKMALINPFKGTTVTVGTEELINASGGGNFRDFSYRFSHYTGSGDISR